MDINISHFLFISAALFAIGFYAAIRRRNIILVLIGIIFILMNLRIFSSQESNS